MTVKVKYVEVEVEISEAHTQRTSVPAWELDILGAIHARREEGPNILGEQWVERDEAPDARGEFARLEQRYGRTLNEDGSKGAPWVAAVYGNQMSGAGSRLASAIAAAVQPVEQVIVEPEQPQRESLDDLGFGLTPVAPTGISQQVSSVGG